MSCWMSGRHYAAEDRRSVEDTHLATARRQWEGNGISGTLKMSRREALFYYLLDLILFYDTGGWKQLVFLKESSVYYRLGKQ